MRSIEILMNEHRIIEKALSLLELAVTRIERGEDYRFLCKPIHNV